jgi:hypothetical protein
MLTCVLTSGPSLGAGAKLGNTAAATMTSAISTLNWVRARSGAPGKRNRTAAP